MCFEHLLTCDSAAGVVPNSDPRQIITPLLLVGLGLGVGEGLGSHSLRKIQSNHVT